MSLNVNIPQDEEFKKLLKEVLQKPDEWYEVRVERAVKGTRNVKRRHLHLPSKG